MEPGKASQNRPNYYAGDAVEGSRRNAQAQKRPPKPSNRRPVKSPHIRPRERPEGQKRPDPGKRPRESKRAPKRHTRGRPELGPKPANAQRLTGGQKRPFKASNSLINAFLRHSGINTHKRIKMPQNAAYAAKPKEGKRRPGNAGPDKPGKTPRIEGLRQIPI